MNPQIKKIIRRISKKSRSNTDEVQNINNNLIKRKFGFFRHSLSSNKLLHSNISNHSEFRNSVDIAEIQRTNDETSSSLECSQSVNAEMPTDLRPEQNNPVANDVETVAQTSLSENLVKPSQESECRQRLSESAIGSRTPRTASTIDSVRTRTKREPVQVQMKSQMSRSHDMYVDSHLSGGSTVVMTTTTVDSVKSILRGLLNYPSNFYVCLSYVITVFLLISTLYVAYQVDRLERDLVHLIEKNHNKYMDQARSGAPPTASTSGSPSPSDWPRNRQLLISQLDRISEILRSVEQRLS